LTPDSKCDILLVDQWQIEPETKRKEYDMSNEWKQFNEKLKDSIEEPTKKQMLQMDEIHLAIYELTQEKNSLNQSLSEVNDKLERYYNRVKELLDSDTPPNWAWTWDYKKTNVQWKQEFIKRLGKAEANKILSVAKQKSYPKIGIRFIDPNPEDIPENPIDKAKRNVSKLDLAPPKLSLKEKLAQLKGN
jgi:hypothetical protein